MLRNNNYISTNILDNIIIEFKKRNFNTIRLDSDNLTSKTIITQNSRTFGSANSTSNGIETIIIGSQNDSSIIFEPSKGSNTTFENCEIINYGKISLTCGQMMSILTINTKLINYGTIEIDNSILLIKEKGLIENYGTIRLFNKTSPPSEQSKNVSQIVNSNRLLNMTRDIYISNNNKIQQIGQIIIDNGILVNNNYFSNDGVLIMEQNAIFDNRGFFIISSNNDLNRQVDTYYNDKSYPQKIPNTSANILTTASITTYKYTFKFNQYILNKGTIINSNEFVSENGLIINYGLIYNTNNSNYMLCETKTNFQKKYGSNQKKYIISVFNNRGLLYESLSSDAKFINQSIFYNMGIDHLIKNLNLNLNNNFTPQMSLSEIYNTILSVSYINNSENIIRSDIVYQSENNSQNNSEQTQTQTYYDLFPYYKKDNFDKTNILELYCSRCSDYKTKYNNKIVQNLFINLDNDISKPEYKIYDDFERFKIINPSQIQNLTTNDDYQNNIELPEPQLIIKSNNKMSLFKCLCCGSLLLENKPQTFPILNQFKPSLKSKPTEQLTLIETQPILLESKPVLLESKPVLLETQPILLETQPILLETQPILLETNPDQHVSLAKSKTKTKSKTKQTKINIQTDTNEYIFNIKIKSSK